MKRIRNGLLITAVLAMATCCTVFATQDAGAFSKLGAEPVPQIAVSKPDSGEPDSGSTRNPPKTAHRPSSTDRSGSSRDLWVDADLLKWVGRIWMFRHLGTGL